MDGVATMTLRERLWKQWIELLPKVYSTKLRNRAEFDILEQVVRAERRAAFEQCREMAAAKALEYVRYCEYGCAQKISADIAALQPPEEP